MSITVWVCYGTYSVLGHLLGETLEVRVVLEQLEVWYAGRCVERLSRTRGEYQHGIHYWHVIDWLVRNPGAFAEYRYEDDRFPTS